MEEGLISKVQRYSTKDGPGIRSTVFMMGCNLVCQWCANPELITPNTKVLYHQEKCQCCGLCVQKASNGSIRIEEGSCHIDREACTNLNEMVDICPYDAYELLGERITANELSNRLFRDRDFYTMSNGGVTFSGGEAALQAEFVIKVTKELKKKGVHVCLDTAGAIPWERLKKLVQEVDMVLYDIKAYDAMIHMHCTSKTNTTILNNAKKISELNIPMIIRFVIVPGYNDQWEDIKNRIDFISSLGKAVKQVDILPYHNLGVGKYYTLGVNYPIKKEIDCDPLLIQKVKEYICESGLKVTVGG